MQRSVCGVTIMDFRKVHLLEGENWARNYIALQVK
jgi:hypothetical protein